MSEQPIAAPSAPAASTLTSKVQAEYRSIWGGQKNYFPADTGFKPEDFEQLVRDNKSDFAKINKLYELALFYVFTVEGIINDGTIAIPDQTKKNKIAGTAFAHQVSLLELDGEEIFVEMVKKLSSILENRERLKSYLLQISAMLARHLQPAIHLPSADAAPAEVTTPSVISTSPTTADKKSETSDEPLLSAETLLTPTVISPVVPPESKPVTFNPNILLELIARNSDLSTIQSAFEQMDWQQQDRALATVDAHGNNVLSCAVTRRDQKLVEWLLGLSDHGLDYENALDIVENSWYENTEIRRAVIVSSGIYPDVVPPALINPFAENSEIYLALGGEEQKFSCALLEKLGELNAKKKKQTQTQIFIHAFRELVADKKGDLTDIIQLYKKTEQIVENIRSDRSEKYIRQQKKLFKNEFKARGFSPTDKSSDEKNFDGLILFCIKFSNPKALDELGNYLSGVISALDNAQELLASSNPVLPTSAPVSSSTPRAESSPQNLSPDLKFDSESPTASIIVSSPESTSKAGVSILPPQTVVISTSEKTASVTTPETKGETSSASSVVTPESKDDKHSLTTQPKLEHPLIALILDCNSYPPDVLKDKIKKARRKCSVRQMENSEGVGILWLVIESRNKTVCQTLFPHFEKSQFLEPDKNGVTPLAYVQLIEAESLDKPMTTAIKRIVDKDFYGKLPEEFDPFSDLSEPYLKLAKDHQDAIQQLVSGLKPTGKLYSVIEVPEELDNFDEMFKQIYSDVGGDVEKIKRLYLSCFKFIGAGSLEDSKSFRNEIRQLGFGTSSKTNENSLSELMYSAVKNRDRRVKEAIEKYLSRMISGLTAAASELDGLLRPEVSPLELKGKPHSPIVIAEQKKEINLEAILLPPPSQPAVTSTHLTVDYKFSDVDQKRVREFMGRELPVILSSPETPLNNFCILPSDIPLLQELILANASLDVIEDVLKNKPNLYAVDKGGNTALHLAIYKEDKNLCALICKYQKEFGQTNNQGLTPLQYAQNIESGKTEKPLSDAVYLAANGFYKEVLHIEIFDPHAPILLRLALAHKDLLEGLTDGLRGFVPQYEVGRNHKKMFPKLLRDNSIENLIRLYKCALVCYNHRDNKLDDPFAVLNEFLEAVKDIGPSGDPRDHRVPTFPGIINLIYRYRQQLTKKQEEVIAGYLEGTLGILKRTKYTLDQAPITYRELLAGFLKNLDKKCNAELDTLHKQCSDSDSMGDLVVGKQRLKHSGIEQWVIPGKDSVLTSLKETLKILSLLQEFHNDPNNSGESFKANYGRLKRNVEKMGFPTDFSTIFTMVVENRRGANLLKLPVSKHSDRINAYLTRFSETIAASISELQTLDQQVGKPKVSSLTAASTTSVIIPDTKAETEPSLPQQLPQGASAQTSSSCAAPSAAFFPQSRPSSELKADSKSPAVTTAFSPLELIFNMPLNPDHSSDTVRQKVLEQSARVGKTAMLYLDRKYPDQVTLFKMSKNGIKKLRFCLAESLAGPTWQGAMPIGGGPIKLTPELLVTHLPKLIEQLQEERLQPKNYVSHREFLMYARKYWGVEHEGVEIHLSSTSVPGPGR